VGVFGSIRVTVWSLLLAVHKASSPRAIAVGVEPTGIWATIRFEFGSMTPTELGATRENVLALPLVSSSVPATIAAASKITAPAMIIRPPLRRRPGELGIVLQDLPLQLPQRRARLEPELVDEQLPKVAVNRECVALPPRAVKSQHEQASRALAERLLAHEALELRNELAVPAELHVRLNPVLERLQPTFFEVGDRALRKRVVGDLGERRAGPQTERLAQSGRRDGRRLVPRLADERVEALAVQFAGLDPKEITGRTTDDPVAELLSE
jgi:hypothetical protein